MHIHKKLKSTKIEQVNKFTETMKEEVKVILVVVYVMSKRDKYHMLTKEIGVGELSSSNITPLLPVNFQIMEMAIGEAFIEKFKKQYNIK
jgi:hypothetical protein